MILNLERTGQCHVIQIKNSICSKQAIIALRTRIHVAMKHFSSCSSDILRGPSLDIKSQIK